ncbi:ABC transporter ATP-binding protein [Mucisphaera calidilacus]|uniref:Putative ABC transporter ATP-binding protein YxlF n=1 Tax=Mucisphaera calidilacus TaxID=2527982 RepID=A0A518BV61_9BACT|nr:ABC transporter ATP-binding protein [Mucisphaera calidilacus]QDU70856.1 putative ABC transporter ATP-binding protein YxlF [Mucisphaera calidilacus]
MIQADDLVKWYGPTLAVDHVSFEVAQGQIVGFLGPNGAGKSTTIRMLTGYLPATAGTARIGGFDVARNSRQARALIGYLPESTPLYPEMRVDEYLDYRGRLLGMPRQDRIARRDEVVDRCGLTAMRRRTIDRLSKGNRQRVGLAQALLHNPPVLILDEPTAGLDPAQIGAFRTLFRELADNHTILLSSHILPEIEKTADRVVMIAGGQKAAEGTLDEIRRQSASGGGVIVQAKSDANALAGILRELPGVASANARDLEDGWAEATLIALDDTDLRELIARRLSETGALVRELRVEAPSLEAFFIEMTANQRVSNPTAA